MATKSAVVAYIDANLQHGPVILGKLLEELNKSSGVVLGSRYIKGAGTEHGGLVAQWSPGVELKDPMSEYFLMWRKDFCAIQGDLSMCGFKILLEILWSCSYGELPTSDRSGISMI